MKADDPRDQEPIAAAPVLSAMKVREENCNMLLLTAVTLFSAIVAVVANWWQAPQKIASAKPEAYVADRSPVRLVGAPFVPNTNPRARQ